MKQIIIAPLSTPLTMTVSAWDAILHADRLYMQTAQHPSAKPVIDAGLAYVSMDDLYETVPDFEALNQCIAERLCDGSECVYAVMGDGCFAQLSAIEKEANKRGYKVSVLPGVPYAKAAFPSVQDADFCTARTLPEHLRPETAICIQELDNAIIAGEVKLKLSEVYPEDWQVTLAFMQRDGSYLHTTIPLYELDRQKNWFAGTVLYVPPITFDRKTKYGYYDLVNVMGRLRAPGGCPWDREQTHATLKRELIEECYELNDSIDEQDDAHILEELGDVLMLVVFHATIADEQGRFTEADVADGIVKKLIYRHPHVFGEEHLNKSEEVLAQWDELKRREKNQTSYKDVLCSVPKGFPALMRSEKIQKKARKVGFDWNTAEDALPKVKEELCELESAMETKTNIAEEAGDLLFAVVNVIRLLGYDSEQVLHDCADKFITRFAKMEELASSDGHTFEKMSLSEQDAYWEKAKKCLKSSKNQ